MQSDRDFTAQLEKSRQGDPQALNAMLGTCRSILRQRARGLLGGRHAARADTSDIVQETMAQAFQDIQNFRGQTQGEWMAWLRSILLAKAQRLRRRHCAEKRAVGLEAAGAANLASQVAERSGGAAARLIESERQSQLTMALEQLPESMSEVIVRRIFLQQRFDEVAAALDRTPEATRVLWTRAVRRLRDTLPASFFSENDIRPPES